MYLQCTYYFCGRLCEIDCGIYHVKANDFYSILIVLCACLIIRHNIYEFDRQEPVAREYFLK